MLSIESQATGAGLLTALALSGSDTFKAVDRPLMNLVEEGYNLSKLPNLLQDNPRLASSLLAKANTPLSLTQALASEFKLKKLPLKARLGGSLAMAVPITGAVGSLAAGAYSGLLGGDKETTANHLATGIGMGVGGGLGLLGAKTLFQQGNNMAPMLSGSTQTKLMSRHGIPLGLAGAGLIGGLMLSGTIKDKIKEKLLGKPEASPYGDMY